MLDRDGPVPLYVQVAELIHERISGGQLRVGDAVPSEAAMEEEFGIARTTARNVARELRRRRLVHTVQGEGTFVGPLGVPRAKPPKAIYTIIAAEVAARIRRGELRPNRAIPSEKALMRHFGVAKVTARQAVALLREQRWVYSVPHRGTFVSDPADWPGETGTGEAMTAAGGPPPLAG
ncbi:winged helix-turn-helix domain-containing protein [Nonomuraea zeae]|uniref:Winged helix-turn-helix transcriptional regulator n=1 Tax=Nonomuraea zeae TaxID=1642303 RepID=A0A5S4GFZ3_9ACTN|nr:winged helix-turn-helix domain-containing protein [Nonomuraea zeae]TMR31898.1 winged helix-turn-helix transcriptional regulator [Nonomuraea zeae]